MWGWMVVSYGANIISGVATGFVMVWAAASRCETRALSMYFCEYRRRPRARDVHQIPCRFGAD